MDHPTLARVCWKAFILALGVAFGAMIVWAACYSERSITPGRAGSLGIKVGDGKAGPMFPVLEVSPGTPAASVGLKAGNWIVFDRLGDKRRKLGADESVGIQVVSDAPSRHLLVRVTPIERVQSLTKINYFLSQANSMLFLVLALLIGLRKPESLPARLLSLALMSELANFLINVLPGGEIQNLTTTILRPLNIFVVYSSFLLFTMTFPDGSTKRQPVWVRRIWPVHQTLFGAWLACQISFNLGLPSFSDQVLNDAKRAFSIASVLLSFASLRYSYVATSGDARQRIRWIVFSLCPIYLIYLLNNAAPSQLDAEVFTIVRRALVLASALGLAYAMLRIQIFDLGFVVNRAIVYGVVSVLLLVSFGVLEWLSEHYIHLEQRKESAILDGAIALGVYLVFHRLRHMIEHVVEQVFFRQWHLNEENLRRFLRLASQITEPAPLLDAFVAALQRFTDGAGCAIYQRTQETTYVRTRVTAMALPAQIDVNDPLVVEIRTDQSPVSNSDARSPLAYALALPMFHRGVLDGFVLVGAKANHESYRPDEVAVLSIATHQIGHDLDGLQIQELRRDVNHLNQEIGILRNKIKTLGAFARREKLSS
jgi:hypothetical protein